MTKRLQVRLNDEEYEEIQVLASRRRMSMAEWVRQALRSALDDQSGAVGAKLRAIAEASRHQFPTADIDLMLQEIETGRRLGCDS